MKSIIRSQRRGLTVMLACLLAACSGEPTGTKLGSVDAARTTDDLAALRAVLDRPAWRSFAALSGQFGIGATNGILASSAKLVEASAMMSAGESTALATSVTRAIVDRAATAIPNLPAIGTTGTTFVYDPGQHRYVADLERTGAPVSGVRFILYEVDALTHEPLVDQEVGYADLVDEGRARPSGIGLHLTVVAGGVAFVDYHVIADGDAGHGSLAVSGLVTDGVTQVNLELSATAQRTATGEQGTVKFTIAVPNRDFTVTASIHGIASGDHHAGSIDLAIHSGPTVIGVSMKGADQIVDGGVTVNGHPFATIHGTGEGVDVRGAGGRPLTSDEREMLGGIMQLAGSVFEMFSALLGPVALTFMLVGISS